VYSVRVVGDAAPHLTEAGKKIDTAIAFALTSTAKEDVVPALYAQMRQDFDRPTPYTLNSFYVRAASPARLVAEVLPKTDSFKGSPADKYLGPEIYGGDRKLKRLELRLQRVGLMKPGQYALPGEGAGLDAYGNISRGQVTTLLSELGAMLDVTTRSISQARLRRLSKANLLVGRGFGVKGQKGGFGRRMQINSRYFVAKSKVNGEPLGVYVLLSKGNVKPVLVFVRKPTYQVRLQWGQVADQVVAKSFPQRFNKALERVFWDGR